MAMIHWLPKQNELFSDTTAPGALVNVDFMEKDSKRFADSGGWGYADYAAATGTFKPGPQPARRRSVTTPSAGSHATRERRIETTCLPNTGNDDPKKEDRADAVSRRGSWWCGKQA